MLAPQNQQPTVIDAMKGTVSSWYNDIDECIKLSEIIPGNYDYTTATSYGNVGQIPEGSSTKFDITADRFKIVSLDNSNIYLDQYLDINVPIQTGNALGGIYYIGYEMSAMAISQYTIYSNTDQIQTVNHANYEWFVMNNSISDEAKEGNECFATINKIREGNTQVPGTYCDFSAITAPKIVSVTIHLKIPLSHFLLLFNLRWHPEWAGKITLELTPSYKNLVIAPVISNTAINSNKMLQDCLNTSPLASLGFHNLNQTSKNLFKSVAAGNGADAHYTVEDQSFKCSFQTSDKCRIKMATYMLQMEVFQNLALKYSEIPLIFPIQTIESKDFTTPLDTSSDVDSAMTVCLKHCDSAYTVFKTDIYSTTCFINPCLESYYFNIDGNFYPREPYNSYNDSRNTNQTLDALNINNSLLSSISQDIRTSMFPYRSVQKYDANGNATTTSVFTTGDRSNFFIGIPFCDSNDFMGGISTSGTVQIQLKAKRGGYNDIKGLKLSQPVTIFVQDAFLKIRSIKPPGRAQIEITNCTIQEIIASKGR